MLRGKEKETVGAHQATPKRPRYLRERKGGEGSGKGPNWPTFL